MAYEIINQGPTTPARLHAVLRLVARRPGLTRQEIADLIQPKAVSDSQNAVKDVLAAALSLGLVEAASTASSPVRLTVGRAEIDGDDAYRATMVQRLLGVTDEEAPNFLLNLFTAWYAALDDEVLRRPTNEIVVEFNQRVFPASEGQRMNDTKLAAWRPWATFLGHGWLLRRGTATLVVPDCTARVGAVVERRLARERVPFAELRAHVAEACPELDGGALYERAWLSGRAGAGRAQTVSLMLSTALRSLHAAGRCHLESVPDALHTWSLFPATGEALATVSHASRGREASDG